jgi:hypothetical protein
VKGFVMSRIGSFVAGIVVVVAAMTGIAATQGERQLEFV